MAIKMETYHLYQLKEFRFLLIRASRPGYNNAIQKQVYQADSILQNKVSFLLERYLLVNRINTPVKYIGEFQGLPHGDILYEKKGRMGLENFRFATTCFKNSIFISIASSEDEFIKIIESPDFNDSGLAKEDLNLPSESIDLIDFITENDFDLSSVNHAYTIDLEDNISI